MENYPNNLGEQEVQKNETINPPPVGAVSSTEAIIKKSKLGGFGLGIILSLLTPLLIFTSFSLQSANMAYLYCLFILFAIILLGFIFRKKISVGYYIVGIFAPFILLVFVFGACLFVISGPSFLSSFIK